MIDEFFKNLGKSTGVGFALIIVSAVINLATSGEFVKIIFDTQASPIEIFIMAFLGAWMAK